VFLELPWKDLLEDLIRYSILHFCIPLKYSEVIKFENTLTKLVNGVNLLSVPGGEDEDRLRETGQIRFFFVTDQIWGNISEAPPTGRGRSTKLTALSMSNGLPGKVCHLYCAPSCLPLPAGRQG
jgi:hypothetical protein